MIEHVTSVSRSDLMPTILEPCKNSWHDIWTDDLDSLLWSNSWSQRAQLWFGLVPSILEPWTIVMPQTLKPRTLWPLRPTIIILKIAQKFPEQLQIYPNCFKRLKKVTNILKPATNSSNPPTKVSNLQPNEAIRPQGRTNNPKLMQWAKIFQKILQIRTKTSIVP